MSLHVLRRVTPALAVALLLNACGGGGSKSPDQPSTPPPPPAATYSISGALSGLAGGSLVVRNGDESLTLSANGAFSFVSSVSAGGRYNVVVVTQPSNPAQTCTVTNGSGIANGNVTDLAITCATSTHTLGGTVSGLRGTGLVLHTNAGEDLPIAADGAFTFTTPFASGTAYAVTVTAQPGAPAQTCRIEGGSGVIESEIADLSVICSLNAYSVGGTVSGLSGTGLVLHSGSEQLQVNANGAFVFPTAVPMGARYDVRIGNAPHDPVQRCSVSAGRGTVPDAPVADIRIECASVYSTFAYSLNKGNASLSQFAVDTASGTLRLRYGAATGADPVATVSYQAPSGHLFRYVVNEHDGTISGYEVQRRSGTMSGVPGNELATGGARPKDLLLHSTRPFLYVPNAGSDTIGIFAIDEVTGELTPHTPLAAVSGLTSLVLDPLGRFAYVLGASALSVYAIDQTSGELSEVADSRVTVAASATGVWADPAGQHLYVFNAPAAGISTFMIDSSGRLTAAADPVLTDVNATLAAAHPSGRFLYVKHPGSGGLSAFKIDSLTGALAVVTGSPFDAGTEPLAVSFDPTGRFLYTSNAANAAFELRAYAIDSNAGALAQISGSPFAAVDASSSLHAEASGKYLYAAHPDSNQLSAYAIDSRSGALSPLPSSPYNMSYAPRLVVSDVDTSALKFDTPVIFTMWGASVLSHAVGADGSIGPWRRGNRADESAAVIAARAGRFLYAANSTSISVFTYDADGRGVDAGTFEIPAVGSITSIALGADGRNMYVADSTGAIVAMSVNPVTGALGMTMEARFGGLFGAYGAIYAHPIGDKLYALRSTGAAIDVFYAHGSDLSYLQTVNTETRPVNMVLSPNGRYAYIFDERARIDQYRVDQGGLLVSMSAPVQVPGSEELDKFVSDIVIDHQSRFLYLCQPRDSTVRQYAIQSDGTLAEVGVLDVSSRPMGVELDYSGRWLYLSDTRGYILLSYAIDPQSGLLSLRNVRATLVADYANAMVGVPRIQ